MMRIEWVWSTTTPVWTSERSFRNNKRCNRRSVLPFGSNFLPPYILIFGGGAVYCPAVAPSEPSFARTFGEAFRERNRVYIYILNIKQRIFRAIEGLARGPNLLVEVGGLGSPLDVKYCRHCRRFSLRILRKSHI